MREEWTGFNNGAWTKEVNVRDFIQKNYTPYTGDESFLQQDLHRTQQIYGTRCLTFKRRKEKQAVFLIWTQRLFRQLHHMEQAT